MLEALRNMATHQHNTEWSALLFDCLYVRQRFKYFTLLSHLILSTTLGGRAHYYFHLIDEETEAQRADLSG